jgi:Domain of unknown function (DUF4185)
MAASFSFFGDAVVKGYVPAQNADPVAHTNDQQVSPDGFKLHPTMNGSHFDPFTVESPFGVPPRNRTPTGAFSFGGRVYVFAVVDDPDHPPPGLPVSILTSKDHPALTGLYRVEFQFDHYLFWQVAPVVVNNALVPDLPLPTGPGLILLGGGNANIPGRSDSIQLAWMPLPIVHRGRSAPNGIQYYTGSRQYPWSPQAKDAAPLVSLTDYTSVSAAWFPAANTWVMVYSNAGPRHPADSVVARIGPTFWQWSEEIELFNPCREGAYGRYMHWPGLDQIWPRKPPDLGDQPGWAYGAFLTDRFCSWDASSRQLTLYYLLSLSRPYQVQLMRSRVFLAPSRLWRCVNIYRSIAAIFRKIFLQHVSRLPYGTDDTDEVKR